MLSLLQINTPLALPSQYLPFSFLTTPGLFFFLFQLACSWHALALREVKPSPRKVCQSIVSGFGVLLQRKLPIPHMLRTHSVFPSNIYSFHFTMRFNPSGIYFYRFHEIKIPLYVFQMDSNIFRHQL